MTFENVPAFSVQLGAAIDVPELGTVVVDVAYGGMFYVIADVEQLGLKLAAESAGDLTRALELLPGCRSAVSHAVVGMERREVPGHVDTDVLDLGFQFCRVTIR